MGSKPSAAPVTDSQATLTEAQSSQAVASCKWIIATRAAPPMRLADSAKDRCDAMNRMSEPLGTSKVHGGRYGGGTGWRATYSSKES